ncbi:BTB POZ domain-containing 17 [Pelobates cultripes]|uniref:BTB POZ domain-containing 17 n=2 Tax=Pelobates cultripes TaxID=61616 RepID=A0AAD1W7L8_PELCU|nr:BTB POZ domain-containing 17 [Pelobates cultripes]CAH2291604.1 BTB POZ domain-containing 17 [Pelobates cultripes]
MVGEMAQGTWNAGSLAQAVVMLNLLALTDAAHKSDLSSETSGAVINHSSMLIHRLQELLQNGNSSDTTLRVHTTNSDEVKIIHAHQLLLSLHSDIFEGLLLNQSVLTLQEPADCAVLFEKFIRYFYCGEISVHLNQAVPLHRLASKYHVSALQRGVSEYMKTHLASESTQGHVVSWYHYALRMGDEGLQESCLKFLAWNLSTVISSSEWVTVSDDLMVSLLQRSDLVLQNEIELFSAVEEWISKNNPDVPIIEKVLRSIRYAMISPSQLFQIQKQSTVLATYHSSVQDLFFQAFQFHSASPLHFAKYFDVNCSMFVPRNYLSSSWGSQWIINNPARDDRSLSFQTQLGPSNHDSTKKITWNALFSPRWLPVSLRPVYSESVSGASQSNRLDEGKPRLVVTSAMSGLEFAGVTFQKTVLVGVRRQQGKVFVKHVYNVHQSTDEVSDFLVHADLQKRTSEYLIDNSLHLHIIIKPIYHSLIKAK